MASITLHTGETVHGSNEEIGRLEAADFLRARPAKYFAYHTAKQSGLHRGDHITTWTGDELALIVWAGHPFRDGFGGLRQNFRANTRDGVTYSGTAYLSAGDYVRLRAVKS